MNRKWPWAVAVMVVAVGILVAKQVSGPAANEGRVLGSPRPAVLLFADLGEAESSCGCGQIIRLVRAAAKSGVPVREVAPGEDRETTRRYRVTVNPTVVLLDGAGNLVVRHEGEEPAVIEAIRADLKRLSEAQK